MIKVEMYVFCRAANTIWPKAIYEHVMIDASSNMNTLARLLMQGECKDPKIRNSF